MSDRKKPVYRNPDMPPLLSPHNIRADNSATIPYVSDDLGTVSSSTGLAKLTPHKTPFPPSHPASPKDTVTSSSTVPVSRKLEFSFSRSPSPQDRLFIASPELPEPNDAPLEGTVPTGETTVLPRCDPVVFPPGLKTPRRRGPRTPPGSPTPTLITLSDSPAPPSSSSSLPAISTSTVHFAPPDIPIDSFPPLQAAQLLQACNGSMIFNQFMANNPSILGSSSSNASGGTTSNAPGGAMGSYPPLPPVNPILYALAQAAVNSPPTKKPDGKVQNSPSKNSPSTSVDNRKRASPVAVTEVTPKRKRAPRKKKPSPTVPEPAVPVAPTVHQQAPLLAMGPKQHNGIYHPTAIHPRMPHIPIDARANAYMNRRLFMSSSQMSESLEAIRKEHVSLINQLQMQRAELSKGKEEMNQLQQQLMQNHEQMAHVNLESTKQQEIGKRLLTTITTFLPLLPPEFQAFCMSEVDKTRQMSGQQVDQHAAAAAAMQQMFMQQMNPAMMMGLRNSMMPPMASSPRGKPNGMPNGIPPGMQMMAAHPFPGMQHTMGMPGMPSPFAHPSMMHMTMQSPSSLGVNVSTPLTLSTPQRVPSNGGPHSGARSTPINTASPRTHAEFKPSLSLPPSTRESSLTPVTTPIDNKPPPIVDTASGKENGEEVPVA